MLTDKKKRQEYDLYGEMGANGVPPGGQPGGAGGYNPFQEFQSESTPGGFTFRTSSFGGFEDFFGSAGGRGGMPGRRGAAGGEDMSDILSQMMGQFFGGGAAGGGGGFSSGFPGGGAGGFGGNTGFEGFGGRAQRQQPQRAGRKSSPSSSQRGSGFTEPTQSSQYPNKKKSSTASSVNDPIQIKVNVTLEELYSGKTSKLKVKDKIIRNQIEKVPIEKIFEVKILPGSADGQEYAFPSSNDFPKKVVFQLQTKSHKTFERQGNNLHWHCKLKKSEYQKGAKIKIPLLDGNTLLVQTKEYPEIKPGANVPFKGYGMPIPGGNGKKGDLIIHFES